MRSWPSCRSPWTPSQSHRYSQNSFFFFWYRRCTCRGVGLWRCGVSQGIAPGSWALGRGWSSDVVPACSWGVIAIAGANRNATRSCLRWCAAPAPQVESSCGSSSWRWTVKMGRSISFSICAANTASLQFYPPRYCHNQWRLSWLSSRILLDCGSISIVTLVPSLWSCWNWADGRRRSFCRACSLMLAR